MHWSTRSMAPEFGLSQSSVRNVVGLLMNPPDHTLVLAVNEKPQI